MKKTKYSPYLSLEGNIGVGKSTFLKILESDLDISTVFEPVDLWQNINGHNLLEHFYKDIKRWSYSFQNYAFITRIKELTKTIENNSKVCIQERSIFSDKHCFAKNCLEQNNMTNLEWQLYLDWFDWLTELTLTPPSGFIYLKCDPEVCYERIVKRNRAAENNISLNYLKELNNKHEEWLINKTNNSDFIKDTPVLILDCNKDFKEDLNHQEKLIKQVKDFISLKTK